jgi:hypothetical protein
MAGNAWTTTVAAWLPAVLHVFSASLVFVRSVFDATFASFTVP